MTRRESETHCLYSLRMPSLLEFFKKLKCYDIMQYLMTRIPTRSPVIVLIDIMYILYTSLNYLSPKPVI